MKIDIKTGVKSLKYPKKFNHSTDSSAGCFQLLPVFYHEILPKGEIRCNNSLFYSQVLPMSVPTMARYRFRFNQFFVPYKYVWPAWNDYYARNLHYYPNNSGDSATAPGIPAEKPYILQKDLFSLILNDSRLVTYYPSGPLAPDTFDFTYVDINDNNILKVGVWTRKGIVALKVLEHLGYKLTFDLNDDTKLEILTLLCFGKVFLDHYFPSNYAFVDADFYTVNQAFVMDAKDVRAASNHNLVYYQAIDAILNDFTYIYFSNSIFYDAWDKPTSPNDANSIATFGITDPTNNSSSPLIVGTSVSNGQSPANQYKPNNGTAFVSGTASHTGATVGTLTNWTIKALERVQNFVTRYQLSGSRLVDRWLALLGAKLPDPHMSLRIDGHDCEVEIGEVLATADSVNTDTKSSSVLGDKAGKARVHDESIKFEFVNDSESHGLFLILMSTTVDNYIVSGIDRNRLNIDALDCVNPLTDCLQPCSVRKSEIFCSYDGNKNDDPNGHFGFLPQNYEHVCDHHIISGSLVAGSLGADALKGWFPRKYFGTTQQSQIEHHKTED